jgi:TolA-binding protein
MAIVCGGSRIGRNFVLAYAFLAGVLLASGFNARLCAQNLPVPSANIAEQQDYAFADGLYRDGLFQMALEQINKFEIRYPQSARLTDAQFLKAECLFQLAQYQAAARELSEFIRQYPASNLSDNARFRLGESYMKLRRNAEAIEAYKSILEHPKNPSIAGEAAYWIGETYFKDADYNNALKYYTLSYEGFPGNRLQDYAAYSSAWTNEKKGDYSKAAEWYRIVVDKFPKSTLVPSSRVKVGECFYYAKDYLRAIQELTAAKVATDSVSLRGEVDYLIGESYFNLGQYDKAQKQYEGFLKDYQGHRLTNEVQYALAWTLFKERQYVLAAEGFNKLSGSENEIGQAALYRRGVAEKLAGKRQAAMETFAKVVSRDVAGGYADNALYDTGLILFEDKKPEEAKNFFLKVVGQFPTSDVIADASMMLGECYAANGAYDSARAAYEKALSVPGISFETKITSSFQFAWCLMKLGRSKDAAAGFSKFIATYPDHPKSAEASYWLAESDYQAGDFRGALKQYQAIVNTANHPRREEGMYGIGWTYYKQGDYPKAIGAFEQLIVAYPSGKFSFDGRLRLGDCYFQQKDYKKAAGAYRTVIRLFPKNDGADYAMYQLGQTYFRSGDHEQASDQFDAVIKTYPSSSLADDAQYAHGWIKFQRKDYYAAIKDFQLTIANYPGSELAPRAFYSIGDAYYNLHLYPAAENSYRQVIQKFPKSPLTADALKGIQYCLVAQGKSSEAVSAIESYVKENPSSPNTEQLEINKAELLFSQKQFQAAAQAYRSFASKYPQSNLKAQALYWQGKSLQEAGNDAEAAKAYSAAAEVPNSALNITGNALLESARIYLKLKNYEQSFRVLDEAEKRLAGSEFSSVVAYVKGLVFFENGATDDARAKFEFVISKFATTVEADKSRIGLVRIALKDKNLSSAQTLSQQVATSRTDEIGAEAQYLSGITYASGNEWQNAITAFLRVRYVFPSHERWLAKANVGLGKAYEQMKDTPKAREAFQQVLKVYNSGEEFEEASAHLKNLGQ